MANKPTNPRVDEAEFSGVLATPAGDGDEGVVDALGEEDGGFAEEDGGVDVDGGVAAEGGVAVLVGSGAGEIGEVLGWGVGEAVAPLTLMANFWPAEQCPPKVQIK